VCGDGFVDPGEECDDGNTLDGDGCSHDCKIEHSCGDGIVDPGEQCDDANNIDTDGCIACKLAFCGDGFVEAGVEQCDDGNNIDGDGCSAACMVELGTRVSFTGTGCPVNTVGKSISSDQTSFTLIFDNYIVSSGAELAKDCLLTVDAAQTGWCLTVTYRGYVQIDSNLHGEENASYTLDSVSGPTSVTPLDGPLSRDWSAIDTLTPANFGFGTGIMSGPITLTAATGLQLTGTGTGAMTIDSIDGRFDYGCP
jgi:cysteine-rich repeat protein